MPASAREAPKPKKGAEPKSTAAEASAGSDPKQAKRIRDYFKRHWVGFAFGIFFLIATQSMALIVPRLLRLSTDALATEHYDQVKLRAFQLIGVALIGSMVRIASRMLIFNSGRQVEYELRNDLFRDLTRLAPSYYGKTPTGELMSRAVNDLTQIRLLLGPGLLNLTNTGLVYIVVVPMLLLRDWSLALCALSVLPLLMAGGRIFGRKMYDHSHATQARLGELSSQLQENLGGIMTVRAYRRERAEESRFAALNERYLDVNMKLAKLRGFMFPMMGLFGAVGTVIVLYMGGQRMIDGRMTVGQFVEFNAYLTALSWPTIALGWMLSLWQRGLASMARVNEIFQTVPTIVDGPRTDHPEGPGRLEICDLNFTYPNAATPALRGVRTVIEPGETIVIVGRTGSGKSTLLRAIARLLELPRGTLFLDGADVLDLPLARVRELIAYAPQDAFLFSRTIAENVALGHPNATDSAVCAAIESAGLGPDIHRFKEGVETPVGERGVTLSGGQRQRVALARSLLVEPRILLLDDTLAAVDTETENRILASLAQGGEGRTTILVTHRLACAEMADRILVLDQGRIVEQGTEDELLALGGIYAEMHRRQRLRQAIEAVAQAEATAAEKENPRAVALVAQER